VVKSIESTHLIPCKPTNANIFSVDKTDHNQISMMPVNFNIYNKMANGFNLTYCRRQQQIFVSTMLSTISEDDN